ncbi:glycosyltransferase family 2 protein [Microbacterium sp. 4R-513]|uniref:glycosyltransferase family 2 protein n=1 Tax=Microbacterium sp. 4R-513 TaxID=2567934 RepID=UPI0013E10883|nr:glycosyltransferase family 2 protein [Microbacterium sp. 4R-513]QIG38318.1 glycosyltransferase family 2 protein [Microbacterium sp. 4R-513]
MPDDAERTAGVVLAYHPTDEIRHNVARLLTQVPHVFVVNNSPDEASRATLDDLDADRVTVLEQDGNVGVAAGFNAGMRAALDAGFDFVWIFDQDSTVADGMLDALHRARARTDVKVGIVGPALRAAETGNVYDADRGQGSAPIEALISSGALFSRALLDEIGLHDEALFIDYVDHDISLRAARAGYTNLKVFDTLLDHRFGDSEPARFLWRKVYLANYSPMRHYYTSRNRVIVVRRFGPGKWFRDDVRYAAKAWIKVLVCERGRPKKVGAFFRGLRDGVAYREV